MLPSTGPVAEDRNTVDVFTVIRNRRKHTAYLPKKIPGDTLRLIVEMAHAAPTGGGYDSREFIVVTDMNLLDGLSKTHPHSTWLSNATAALAILGNPSKSKYWVEDSSIAAEHTWLAATALGLGACWAAIYQSDDPTESRRREDYVRSLLNIPDNIRPVAILGLGFPSNRQPPSGTSAKRDLNEVLYMNQYGARGRL